MAGVRMLKLNCETTRLWRWRLGMVQINDCCGGGRGDCGRGGDA